MMRDNIKTFLLGIGSVIALVVLLPLFVLAALAELLQWAPSLLIIGSGFTRVAEWAHRSQTHRLVASAGAVAFAGFLYWYRSWSRMGYGRLELGFATLLVWFSLGGEQLSPNQAAAVLLGAVFVFVRGLDNYRQGSKEATERKNRKRAEAGLPPFK